MIGTTLLFTRKDKGSAHDDKITIAPYSGSREIFEITYRSPGFKMDRRFLASFPTTLNYLEDILTSMRHDTDPFEYIQILTNIHPDILYHMSDMDESMVRDLILDMIRDSMRFDTSSVPR